MTPLFKSVFKHQMTGCLLISVQKTELEASASVSEGESSRGGRAVPPSSPPTSGVSHPQAAEGSRRSLSSWVRSAQALLQTPQKAPNRQPKTPEDSGKKKRKFQRCDLFFFFFQVNNTNTLGFLFFFPIDVKNNKSMLDIASQGGGRKQTTNKQASRLGPGVRCLGGNVSAATILSKRTPGVTRGR